MLICMAMLIASVGFIVDRVAIRDAGLHPPAVGQVAFSVAVAEGVDLPVYSAGSVDGGCVILFPGQHGLAGGFESQLVPSMASRGIATFTATYAARPGAARLRLEQARGFALEVVRWVEQRCGRRYVVIGRSLGSMLAAYATRGHRPAALLLEGASPSLAAALRSAMTPLLGNRLAAWMPLERLLTTNYNLRDALGPEPQFPVTIIQGTRDARTPMSDLTAPGAVPAWVEVVPVPGADHQGTWRAFMPEYVERIAGALEAVATEQDVRQPDLATIAYARTWGVRLGRAKCLLLVRIEEIADEVALLGPIRLRDEPVQEAILREGIRIPVLVALDDVRFAPDPAHDLAVSNGLHRDKNLFEAAIRTK